MKATMTLREKIEREEAKLKKLSDQRDEITRKMRKIEQNLTTYKLMENNERLGMMNALAEGAGISVSDIMNALQDGDLDTLQEKMKAAKENTKDGGGE